jgi:alpha-glucosidase
MWNTDTYGYSKGTDPIYVSVPFFMALKGSKAYGIYFDNSYRTFFDFGIENEDRYTFGSNGGDLRYYFFSGPEVKDIM